MGFVDRRKIEVGSTTFRRQWTEGGNKDGWRRLGKGRRRRTSTDRVCRDTIGLGTRGLAQMVAYWLWALRF